MVTSEQEVEQFLADIQVKISVWDLIFRNDRQKNMQCFADLEITQSYAKEVIKELKVSDYSEGPLEEKLHNLEGMWVFGKNIKNKEVYIKITAGVPGTSVICISFHVAEYQMNYPFKK